VEDLALLRDIDGLLSRSGVLPVITAIDR
jgi:hypothetical protein